MEFVHKTLNLKEATLTELKHSKVENYIYLTEVKTLNSVYHRNQKKRYLVARYGNKFSCFYTNKWVQNLLSKKSMTFHEKLEEKFLF